MANDFFRKSGAPNVHTVGTVAQLLSEFVGMEAGFNKLPGFVGNASKILAVNAGGTAVDAVTGILISSQLTANGYYIFPGDDQLVFQWITSRDANLSGSETIILPISFTNQILHVMVTSDSSINVLPVPWDTFEFHVPGVDFAACTKSQIVLNCKGKSGTNTVAKSNRTFRCLVWGN